MRYLLLLKPIGFLSYSLPVASTSQDLREINRPLLERLSPACAGQTGDDHADAQVIRDDWVRLKARDISVNGRRRLT